MTTSTTWMRRFRFEKAIGRFEIKMKSCLASVALACSSLGVYGGEAQPSSESLTTLSPVVVTASVEGYKATESSTATRSEKPLLQTAQSVQVVPRSVIDDQNSSQLAGALRNVSGVSFDFGFNGSAQPLVILRGFPSSSQSSGAGSMSSSSTYYLDGTKVNGIPVNMFNVDAVEVVKGPSAVLYGRSEPGGLINIASKPISSVRRLGFEQAVGQYGQTLTGAEATGAINASKSLSARVAGSHSSTDSIRDFVKDEMDALSGGLSWDVNKSTRVVASIDYTDQRYRSDYGVPAIGNRPADLPWSRQFNNSPELSKAQTAIVKLEVTKEISEKWSAKGKYINVRAKTSEMDISTYRFNNGSTTPGEDCPGDGNLLCRYYSSTPDGRNKIDQFNLDIIGKVATGGFQHRLQFGIENYEAIRTGVFYQQQISSVDIHQPVEGTGPHLDMSDAQSFPSKDSNKWTSLYIQNETELPMNLFLTLALRTDKTSAALGSPDIDPNDQTFTTPRAQLLWRVADNQSAYIQYQEALSANNGRDAVTKEALAAERASAWEIGYKVELLSRRVTSTVSMYELKKKSRGQFVRLDQAPFFNVVPVGEARSRGVEWDVAGEISSRWSVIGSYAYTDAGITDDLKYEGKRLPNVARHSGSIWARYAIGDNWVAGAGIFAMGQREGDNDNTFQMPGYARIDIMTNYNFMMFGAQAKVQLNIDNVLDKKYFEGSHQFVSDYIRLGSPRTARLTLRIDI